MTYNDSMVPLLHFGMVVVLGTANGALTRLYHAGQRRRRLKASSGWVYIVGDLLQAVEGNRLHHHYQ